MNSNYSNTNKVINKKESTVVEIKLGAGRKSISGRFSARPTKSLFRSKSIKKAFITSAEKTLNIKSLLR